MRFVKFTTLVRLPKNITSNSSISLSGFQVNTVVASSKFETISTPSQVSQQFLASFDILGSCIHSTNSSHFESSVHKTSLLISANFVQIVTLLRNVISTINVQIKICCYNFILCLGKNRLTYFFFRVHQNYILYYTCISVFCIRKYNFDAPGKKYVSRFSFKNRINI